MTRVARWLLLAGVLLFTAILIWQGLPAVLSTLSLAGVGLLLVPLFHVIPLILDAAAVRVFFPTGTGGGSLRDTILTRWVGESANSLMPAGQLGGPVLMVRQLVQRGIALPLAAAAITVSTTFQLMSQIVFALLGVAVFAATSDYVRHGNVRTALAISFVVLALFLISFFFVQKRGLFRSALRPAARFLAPRNLAGLVGHAQAIDKTVSETYAKKSEGAASFGLNLLAWLIGTGEVYLILWLLKAPVGWQSALILESLGQAIRSAAFAIPGSLGVQEGGYILLAPLAGLHPETALALSLAKRAREFLLGVPGLVYLQRFERHAVKVGTA
jgi:putative membrane protein